MGNEKSGLLAFPLTEISLFSLVLSLTKGIFWLQEENEKEKELCELLNDHRTMR
jgi:hypothetical protein